MTPLTLVGAPSPIRVGQTVHVPIPVTLSSGCKIRRGRYTVIGVEGKRLIIETRLDCSALDARYNPHRDAEGRWVVPFCCEPKKVYLDPGTYTAYASGDGPVLIPDLPLIPDSRV